jgi:hypothetical protein
MATNLAELQLQTHAMIDRLAPQQLAAVRSLLEVMLDPVARAAASAPLDDEPATEEDHRRISEGSEWFARRGGKGIPMEEVLAEFGLKLDDFSDASESPQ